MNPKRTDGKETCKYVGNIFVKRKNNLERYDKF